MIQRILFYCLLAITLLIAPFQSSLAKTQLYQIELIIFSQLDQKAWQSEHWPALTSAPNNWYQAQEITPVDYSKELIGYYTLLPEHKRVHQQSFKQIKAAKNYHPLTYLAWQQPISSEARHIRFTSGNEVNPTAQRGNVFSSFSSLFNESKQNLATTEPQQKTLELQGTLGLSKKLFFEVDLDIVYRVPMERANQIMTDATMHASSTTPVRMRQERRMRSSELHYFDHPLFGVLMSIIPISMTYADELKNKPSLLLRSQLSSDEFKLAVTKDNSSTTMAGHTTDR